MLKEIPRIMQVCLATSATWLSFCIGFNALRSSEISIDIANKKVSLAATANTAQMQLQSTLIELEKVQLELQSLRSKRVVDENKKAIATLKPQIQESIGELEDINEKLRR